MILKSIVPFFTGKVYLPAIQGNPKNRELYPGHIARLEDVMGKSGARDFEHPLIVGAKVRTLI
jgi:hypothetical protein